MNGNHFRTQIFGDMREFRCVQAPEIPTHAHFYRDGHRHRFHRRFDQAGGQWQVAHQCGPSVPIHNLFHGAAHVDIDDRGTAFLIELGRLAHFIRRAACELHRHRLFNHVPSTFLQRLARFADHCLTGDHLGNI